jgi:hypothetical protein
LLAVFAEVLARFVTSDRSARRAIARRLLVL